MYKFMLNVIIIIIITIIIIIIVIWLKLWVWTHFLVTKYMSWNRQVYIMTELITYDWTHEEHSKLLMKNLHRLYNLPKASMWQSDIFVLSLRVLVPPPPPPLPFSLLCSAWQRKKHFLTFCFCWEGAHNFINHSTSLLLDSHSNPKFTCQK